MATYICDYSLPEGYRKQKRHALIFCFLNECAGNVFQKEQEIQQSQPSGHF